MTDLSYVEQEIDDLVIYRIVYHAMNLGHKPLVENLRTKRCSSRREFSRNKIAPHTRGCLCLYLEK